MEQDYSKLQNSLISIASELFRFQKVFEKAISKLDIDERNKYDKQTKKVIKRLWIGNKSNIN